MYSFFYNYILFIIETITFFIILFIFVYFIKFLKKKKNSFIISHLNHYYILSQKNIITIVFSNIEKKAIIKNLYLKYKCLKNNGKRIFVINFDHDVSNKELSNLSKIISFIILVARKNDEVLVKLTSSGGFVNKYGLIANEFERLRKVNIDLIVSVDFIAASGGYLIAVVANKIIAADFAIIGSIGVLGVVPNFNKFLNKNNIDIEYHSSGEYKSTLSLFGKNTISGRNKFISSLNITKHLFESFIMKYRNFINIDQVSTGEYWYGKNAIDLKLIDKLQTSEEFIMENIETSNIYEINIKDDFTSNKYEQFF